MELDDYRAELDAIDKALEEGFIARMELVKKIGEYKAEHGLPTLDAGREAAVIDMHTENCPVAQELQHKDPERFVPVSWSEPQRPFAADIAVIVSNAVGVLARVTAVLAEEGVDITRIHMDDDVSQQNVLEIDFTVAVKDLAHLQDILRHLRRTPSVQRAERCAPAPEKSA